MSEHINAFAAMLREYLPELPMHDVVAARFEADFGDGVVDECRGGHWVLDDVMPDAPSETLQGHLTAAVEGWFVEEGEPDAEAVRNRLREAGALYRSWASRGARLDKLPIAALKAIHRDEERTGRRQYSVEHALTVLVRFHREPTPSDVDHLVVWLRRHSCWSRVTVSEPTSNDVHLRVAVEERHVHGVVERLVEAADLPCPVTRGTDCMSEHDRVIQEMMESSASEWEPAQEDDGQPSWDGDSA